MSKMEKTIQTKIRNAKLSDSEGIYKLAESVKINFENPQKYGFLVYSKDYKKIIKYSKYFYVIKKEENILAFLMCYDNQILEKLISFGEFSHEDKIIEFVSKQKKPYLFGDQIAVSQKNNLKGIGKKLMLRLFRDMINNNITDIYVGILHEPIKNMASLNFCNSFGFSQIAEVKNKDNLVWGIYKLNIEK